MKADILSPKAMFSRDVRYVIPTFQRPYVWTQEDQWEPLWEDVRNTAERFLDELTVLGEGRDADAEAKTPAHFLGAVVLQQQPTAARDIDQRHVIDGQQRLTTLQLLLDAARHVFSSLSLASEARRISKLVFNDKELIDEEEHLFKVWPTRVDQDGYKRAILNGVNANGQSQISAAHEFFRDQISQWLSADTECWQQRAGALETTLTGLLQMVVIDLESKDDAHMIFETLNARGTPLIDSDLIKNFVLYTAKENGKDEDRFYQEYWRHLDDDWWRKEVRQGRIVRPRLDMFLNYWLIMRTVSDVPAGRVFEEFQKYASRRDIEPIAIEINRESRSYRELESRPDSTIEPFIYRRQVMDAGVITPVLLSLFTEGERRVPPAVRVRATEAIESFLIRRMICRTTTKDYNRLFLDLVGVLNKATTLSADRLVVDFLAGQTADSREWPSDERVTAAVVDLPLYRLLTRGRLRLILEAVETELRGPRAEERDVRRDLTIEHVLPQRWREHWPIPQGVDADAFGRERDRLIHTLGNLTLVNERLNPSLSNGGWTSKRNGLQSHSVLYLNKEILNNPLESEWNHDSIVARGNHLAELVCKIWPGPDSTKWDSAMSA